MSRFKVLSTKRLNAAMVGQLKESGIDLVEKEFIQVKTAVSKETEDIICNPGNTEQAVIFTSANAILAIASLAKTKNWEVFCLSGKTQEAVLENLPASRIIATADNAGLLAEQILQKGIKKVVFFCGDHRRDELPSILKSNNIEVVELVVYHTMETPVEITEDNNAVLFFSQSAVKSFFSINKISDHTICFAIGSTTAEELKNHTTNKIIVAGYPSQEKLVDELVHYIKQVVQE